MNRLDFASTLARDAGRLAHSAFGKSVTTLKGRHDIVTVMDRQVERFIRTAVAQQYPDDALIGEEEGGSGGDRLWIIDPIDGTANYARGIPRYCVSIGYLERGKPVVGALYDPSQDLLYAAARGEGAHCNGEPMSVSACDDMNAATVECGWSTRRSAEDYLSLVRKVFAAGGAMRRAGSGALGLVDVAAGRIEGYCELHINAWDCAAGILLVQEAGGFSNDFFAGDGLAEGNVLLATNAALCVQLSAATGIACGSAD